jgi:hypothetical protein
MMHSAWLQTHLTRRRALLAGTALLHALPAAAQDGPT